MLGLPAADGTCDGLHAQRIGRQSSTAVDSCGVRLVNSLRGVRRAVEDRRLVIGLYTVLGLGGCSLYGPRLVLGLGMALVYGLYGMRLVGSLPRCKAVAGRYGVRLVLGLGMGGCVRCGYVVEIT